MIGGGVVLALCVVAFAIRPLFLDKRSETPGSHGETGATPSTATNSGDRPGIPSPVGRPEPLRVKSLDVKHFAKTPEGDVPKGILGRGSFSTRLGDRVQVVATLSRPAHAYIIAFRPDGVADLCFPDDEDTVPPLTDTPRYPATDGSKAYGLDEGTGLWVFAVVASEQPLPTFKNWLASRKLNWKPQGTPAGSVWSFDGGDLETHFEGRSEKRAKDVELTGPAATVRSVGRSLEQTPDASIYVVGFGVGPRN